jgi:3alpha(or 20beta)-hydroxysteroid dehydrogenase
MSRLEGKVAIITGSARGTGEQTARLFADEGAKVVVADILEEEGRATAKEIGDSAIFVRLDVTEVESWQNVVARTTEVFGNPTVLVNNAGLLHMVPSSTSIPPMSNASGASISSDPSSVCRRSLPP